MIAREPYLSACLRVVQHATLHARILGWRGEASLRVRCSKAHSGQLADLMDAIHNIPDLILAWEDCDESRLRRDLAAYDEKWARRHALKLLAVYEQALAQE